MNQRHSNQSEKQNLGRPQSQAPGAASEAGPGRHGGLSSPAFSPDYHAPSHQGDGGSHGSHLPPGLTRFGQSEYDQADCGQADDEQGHADSQGQGQDQRAWASGAGGMQDVDAHLNLYDPEYHQWRSEQMRRFDEEYRKWRQERFRRFSEEFNQWRQSRSNQVSKSSASADASASESSSPRAASSSVDGRADSRPNTSSDGKPESRAGAKPASRDTLASKGSQGKAG